MDAWDAIKDNEFFSLEGFVFAFSQMLSVSTPPNRFTPEFQIYKKYKDWEIRRYALNISSPPPFPPPSLLAHQLWRTSFGGFSLPDKGDTNWILRRSDELR